MNDTRTRIPLVLPALAGVAGFTGVVAAGRHGWQLVVSAALAAVLVLADVYRWRSRARP